MLMEVPTLANGKARRFSIGQRRSAIDGEIQNKETYKMETPNIAEKVVVITGASSGIGESTAKLQ
jgi:hypothetical protein